MAILERHSAADSRNAAAIKVLLDHGVDCDAENRDGQTALEYTLYRMRNIDFVAMIDTAQLLLDAGTRLQTMLVSLQHAQRRPSNFIERASTKNRSMSSPRR